MAKKLLNNTTRTNRENTERVLLKQIDIIKFKGLRNKTMKFDGNGVETKGAPNGSGKSTFIDAFAYVFSGSDINNNKKNVSDVSLGEVDGSRTGAEINITFLKEKVNGQKEKYKIEYKTKGFSSIYLNNQRVFSSDKTKPFIQKANDVIGAVSAIQTYINPYIMDVIDTKEGRQWLVNIKGVEDHWDDVHQLVEDTKYNADAVTSLRPHIGTYYDFDQYLPTFSENYLNSVSAVNTEEKAIGTMNYSKTILENNIYNIDVFKVRCSTIAEFSTLETPSFLREKQKEWDKFKHVTDKGFNAGTMAVDAKELALEIEKIKGKTKTRSEIFGYLNHINKHKEFIALPEPMEGVDMSVLEKLSAYPAEKQTTQYIYSIRQELHKFETDETIGVIASAEKFNDENKIKKAEKIKQERELGEEKRDATEWLKEFEKGLVEIQEKFNYTPKGLFAKFIYWITKGKVAKDTASHQLDRYKETQERFAVITDTLDNMKTIKPDVNTTIVSDYKLIELVEQKQKVEREHQLIQKRAKLSQYKEPCEYTKVDIDEFETNSANLPKMERKLDQMNVMLNTVPTDTPTISEEEIVKQQKTWSEVEIIFEKIHKLAKLKVKKNFWGDMRVIIDDIMDLRLSKVNEIIRSKGINLSFILTQKNIGNDLYKPTFSINITTKSGKLVNFATASVGEQLREGIKFNKLSQIVDKVNLPIFIDEAGILDKDEKWLEELPEATNLIMFYPTLESDINDY